MKYNQLIALILIAAAGCGQHNEDPLKIDEAPAKAMIFGEGFISTGLYERDIAISRDGKEIIYTLGDYKQGIRCLVKIEKSETGWTTPQILNISGEYHDIEPFYANDGNRLFFASNRPLKDQSTRNDYNIWYSDRQGDQWGEPVALPENINTEKDEFYPSVSKNGNLYFTATRSNGIGREDIFLSEKVNGEYQEPRAIDSTVNTQYYEFNAYINPEEDLLIFSSYGRADDLGGGDLYYSRKDKNGNWAPAKHMSEKINSNRLDYCPFIDAERKNFYFTSERTIPVDKKLNTVEELIRYANSTQNGLGNIYRISMEELELK